MSTTTDFGSIVTASNVSGAAGRQAGGALWSTLGDVCKLLRVTDISGLEIEETLFQHIPFKAGQRIYRPGEKFEKLFVVRIGFLKTVMCDMSGHEHILNFPMKGDVIGVDGFYEGAHQSEAVALSDGEVIALPYKALAKLAAKHRQIEAMIYGMVSQELMRGQVMVGMLGGLSAEARIARFIVSLGDRFEKIGYSRKMFNLRMTRQEIGSYLGLTLETVSRTFSAFNELGYISVDGRTVGIKDEEALASLRRIPAGRARRTRSNSDGSRQSERRGLAVA